MPVNTAVGILFHRDSPHGQKYSSAEGAACGKRNEHIIIERAGLLLCASSRLADGQMFLRAARKPLGHRGMLRAGLLPRASSRLADGQMFLRAAQKPLGHRRALRAGLLPCASSPVGRWPNVPQSSAKALGASKSAMGRAFALRFVTVGQWPNVPQSSAKALGIIEGRCGPGFCSALRHGVVCLQKSSRSCKTLLYYTGYYRQNKALNCELFCSGYGAAPKNMTKDTTPLCFVL